MRVLMIGWEFPPFFSGGLGIHVYHLTRELSRKGVDVTYVMPKTHMPVSAPWVRIIQAPFYADIGIYSLSGGMAVEDYPSDPLEGARAFTDAVVKTVTQMVQRGERFDVIHCHDWISFPAGIALKRLLNIPLVVTFHATEYSRTADRPYKPIMDIEREAIQEADHIITVSKKIRDEELVKRYGADPGKISVIYNGIDVDQFLRDDIPKIDKTAPMVLFFGRLTFQKGPEYFLRAAQLVHKVLPDAQFVVAGRGFLLPALTKMAAELGIADRTIFITQKMSEAEVAALYRAADVYVMPSVYEPFGITALEALVSGTPVILSKRVGATDIVHHVLTVDYWDVEEMANKIIAVLMWEPLRRVLGRNGQEEAKKYSWSWVADETINKAYKRVIE